MYASFFCTMQWNVDTQTHWNLVKSNFVWEILVNTGAGKNVLPDDTKSLPEPMLTFHQSSPLT